MRERARPARSGSSDPSPRRGEILESPAAQAILLILVTLVVYSPTLRNGFIWDDDSNLTANQTLRTARGLVRIWLDPFSNQQYYPLTHTSLWVQYQLFGLRPWVYHLGNLLLHTGTVLVLWTILRGLALPGAWLAAAIFAVHPLQLESVAWITERKNTLSGLLLALAALLFLRGAGLLGSAAAEPAGGAEESGQPGPVVTARKQRSSGPRTAKRSRSGEAEGRRPDSDRKDTVQPGTGASGGSSVGAANLSHPGAADAPVAWVDPRTQAPRWVAWLAFFVFVLALAAKSAVATAPVVFLAVLWWKRGRVGRREIIAISPFFAVSLVAGLATAWLERRHVGARGEFWSIGFAERVVTAGRALWFYAAKFVVPAGQAFIYPRFETDPARLLLWLFPIGAAAVPLALWALRRRIGRGPAAAAIAYGALIAPASGFFDVFFFRYSIVQDHFQYFACAALAALAAGTIAIVVRGKAAFLAIAAAVVALLGGTSFLRGPTYRDSETLWRDTLARNPRALIACVNLSNRLVEKGRIDEAESLSRRAVEIDARNIDALLSDGRALSLLGRVDEAMSRYREALAVSADQPTAHANLAGLLIQKGNYKEAVEHCDAVIAKYPTYADARINRGIALSRMGRREEAVEELGRAASLPPERADARRAFGTALLQTGRAQEALAQLDRAAALDPADASIHLERAAALDRLGRAEEASASRREAARLGADPAAALNDEGRALLSQGRLEPALERFTEATRLRPEFAVAHYHRGLVLEQLGRTADAIAAYRAAVQAQPDLKEAHNNLAIALYGAGDYAGAWAEVNALRRLGGTPHPGFLEALTRKSPPPG